MRYFTKAIIDGENPARKYFLQAFELPESTAQQSNVSHNVVAGSRTDSDLQGGDELTQYRVLVTGSSIFAIMSGKKDYERALEFLNAKSAKGKLE